jgi:hypothetical protein
MSVENNGRRYIEIEFKADIPANSDQEITVRVYRKFQVEQFKAMAPMEPFGLVDAWVTHKPLQAGKEIVQCLPAPGHPVAMLALQGVALFWPAVDVGDDMTLVIRNTSSEPKHFCLRMQGSERGD